MLYLAGRRWTLDQLSRPDTRRKHRDLILAALGTVILSIFCVAIDAFERLVAFVDHHEAWQLDEAIIILLVAGMASLVLYTRRSHELRREVSQRQAAEAVTVALTRQALSDAAAERRFLQDEVRANAQRLESILATAYQAIVTIDRDGVISGWNRHAERTFGWRAEEVVGRPMSDVIVPPELRAAHDDGLARFMSSRTARLIGSQVEVTALRRNGDVFPIELALSATNIGEDWRFTALIQDISERRAQTELFENAFEHAPIGMALVGLDGRLMKLNSAFCDLIGYAPDEATALDFQTITHSDDLAGDLHLLGRLIAGEIPSYQMEKRYIHKSGRTVWVRLSVSLVLGSDGSPKHLIAQVQDLSAERESEGRYRLLAESSTDVIVTSDLNGRTTFVSPSSEAVTGYTSEERMGHEPDNITHPDDIDELREAFRNLKAGLTSQRVRWRIWHKTQARWVWVESSPALLRDPTTQVVTGYLDVIRDVSAQKEQEDALAAAKFAAEQAMASKEQFLANMSHELRTPLNSIIGFSRLLSERTGLEAEDQRRIHLVHSAGLALHAVIDNVLDFSKLEANKLELHSSPFGAAEFFASTVSLLETQAAARDVRLGVDMDPAVPDRMVGDSDRLRQILLNLLSNAVKFTHDGSVTTRVLLVRRDDRAARLRVEVADTGGGIPKDRLTTLFNRFVQADATVARNYGGTGLGLAISRQLVTLMGGEIGVTSELGKGSTFWFEITLPVADAQECIDDKVSAPTMLSLRGKHILVVDDVDLNRELMLALLSRYGCAVTQAEDGARALARIEAQSFDLVLMDCQMPVMDGFAATRAIREQAGPAAKMPIVALTASAQPEHLARCLAAGMNEHLTKPLNPHALEVVLQRYLGDGERSAAAAALEAASPVKLPLGERYAIRRRTMIEALEAMVCAGQFTDDEVRELATMAHNLAGTAGMFGEAELGNAAAALDVGLANWSREERAERVRESLDTIRAIALQSARETAL